MEKKLSDKLEVVDGGAKKKEGKLYFLRNDLPFKSLD